MRRPGNALLGGILALGVTLMFSFAYANVPLFQMFCARFGIGGAGKAGLKGELPPALSSSTGAVTSRAIRVRFMAVTGAGLPVRFGPETPMVDVHPGRPVRTRYTFTNWSEDSVFFRAVHSIVPQPAAREFQLMQCFCFDDQALGPRETRSLPVYFALSPRTPVGIEEVILSYTLFPRDPKEKLPVSARDVN